MNLNHIDNGAHKRASVDEIFIGLEKYLNGTATESENNNTLKLAKDYQERCLKNGDGITCQAFTEVFNTICKREVMPEVIEYALKKSKWALLLETVKNESAGKTICYSKHLLSHRLSIPVTTLERYLRQFREQGFIEHTANGNTLTVKYIGD